MAVPHSIALAAAGLDPESGLGVVKAWVESGGDVNGFFDPDAHEGGREACHPELSALDDGGESVLLLAVGGSIYDSDNERAYRDRLDLYTSPPHPVIYRAIFAMKDAGKEIQLTQYLIMYFPDWYMSLTEAAQVPYYKYSLPLFIDFMTEYEKLKNAYQSCHSPTAFKEASAKHLALSRYLLSFYTRAYGPGA